MTTAASGPASAMLDQLPSAQARERRLDDLAEMIRAYHEVTEKLHDSHDALQSEIRRLRRELNSANAQLQRSRRLAALGEMAAGIAHEIRNPLAAIQLYAGMVVEDLGQGERSPVLAARENAEHIKDAAKGMARIVDDVLTFAKEFRPQLRPCAPVDLMEQALHQVAPMLKQAGVQVEFVSDLPPQSPLIEADAGLMVQAISNLMRNAIEAMAAVDGERRLMLSVRENEEGFAFRVADTGPGIKPEVLDRIFNPFFTTRGTGTGLGLAIVHRILDAHHGSIVANNRPQGGAVLELTLPAVAQQDTQASSQPLSLASQEYAAEPAGVAA